MDFRGRIRDSDIDAVRERTDIVQLISEYIPLKKSGREFRGPCPFHQEKEPSFYVNPAKGVYYCFGCQASGGVFNFIMKMEGLKFNEAVEKLADRIGYSLTYERLRPEEESRKNEREKLFNLNQTAAEYFHYLLVESPKGKKALEYLEKRGIKKETIGEFFLGFAPEGWHNVSNFLSKKGFTAEELVLAGLSRKREQADGGGIYDIFRNRLIFPIHDLRGRVIAFGGRVLEETRERHEPKYLNSPETPVYRKSRTLYGLHQARPHIQNSKEVVIVEGYTDLLALYQAGMKNVVATLGTALTPGHFELLNRFSEKAYLAFDADRAGQEAAQRPLEFCGRFSLEVLVVKMPEGEDPASLVEKEGLKEFENSVRRAVSIFEFSAEKAIEEFDLVTPAARMKALAACVPIFERISGPRDMPIFNDLVRKVGTMLEMPDETVRVFTRDALKGVQVGGRSGATSRAPLIAEKVEREALRLLLHNSEQLIEHQYLEPEYFQDEENRKIFEMLKEIMFFDEKILRAEYDSIVGRLMEEIEDENLRAHAGRLLVEPPPETEPGLEGEVFDRLSYAYFKREERKIEEELRACDKKLEPKRYDELFRRLVEYDRVIKELFPYDHG
ncbi:MAG: DNA primase [Actinomycetota bacterium]|nr:DNA primase [Actinomycetota bacterium]